MKEKRWRNGSIVFSFPRRPPRECVRSPFLAIGPVGYVRTGADLGTMISLGRRRRRRRRRRSTVQYPRAKTPPQGKGRKRGKMAIHPSGGGREVAREGFDKRKQNRISVKETTAYICRISTTKFIFVSLCWQIPISFAAVPANPPPLGKGPLSSLLSLALRRTLRTYVESFFFLLHLLSYFSISRVHSSAERKFPPPSPSLTSEK